MDWHLCHHSLIFSLLHSFIFPAFTFSIFVSSSLMNKVLPLLLCLIIAGGRLSAAPADSVWPVKVIPQQLPDPVLKTDTPTCIIPFSRVGNLIIVRAKIDTMEGNFILDTGSPDLVLNQTYFRNYELLHDEGAEETAGITGTTATVSKTLVKHFNLGTFHYFNTTAHLTNLGHIENTRGIKILGLIGLQLLKGCELFIDPDSSQVYLHHISKKDRGVYRNPWLTSPGQYEMLPIEIIESKIITRVEIAGKKLKLAIDCGAETNLLDSRLPDVVFDNITISRRILLSGVGARKTEALYGNLNRMKIGEQEVTNLGFVITNLEKTCFSYINCIDGILGFDFLGMRKIGFNFVTNKMYIWK